MEKKAITPSFWGEGKEQERGTNLGLYKTEIETVKFGPRDDIRLPMQNGRRTSSRGVFKVKVPEPGKDLTREGRRS